MIILFVDRSKKSRKGIVVIVKPITERTVLLAVPGSTKMRVGKELGRGGEGRVVEVRDTRFVAKLYDTNPRAKSKAEKVNMLHKFRWPTSIRASVMLPEALLFDEATTFRGYAMERAAGQPLSTKFLDTSWALKDRLRALEDLARIVSLLHVHGVAVGDLSSNNVFATSNSVQLIDVDSFHLSHRFPSEVQGTLRYICPEFLRGEVAIATGRDGDEYSLGFLVFETLHAGLSPYAHKGGSDPSENAKKQFCPWVQNQKLIPDGSYIETWKQLPPELHELFERAFVPGAAPRPAAGEWYRALQGAELVTTPRSFFSFFNRKRA